MKKSKRIVWIFVVVFLFVALGGGFFLRSMVSSGFAIDRPVYIYIDEKKDYDDVIAQIRDSAHVENISYFQQLSSFMKYPQNVKEGRYRIDPKMSIHTVISMLRSGQQTPVKLRFNNIRLKQDLSKRIAAQVMFSEDDLLRLLNDSSVCATYGFNKETIVAMFIPNTYEVYWYISPEAFLKRMSTEYNRFWDEKRKAQAQTLGLTPLEVSVLASIVEEECYYTDEYSKVAGLYLNRLHRGQLLQADPTVKFAVGDFSLKRILNKHLAVESPYNTYRHQGLPPAPIRIPSIKGIDSVLNPASHNYLYMCAKEDFSGRHNFAVTHAEHERNANRYRMALNERRIF